MRIGFDVTALHGPRTGIGEVTDQLLAGLAGRADIELAAFSVSWRGRDRINQLVPEGVAISRRPMAARVLRAVWRRSDRPGIEWWTGPVDVVHGVNFVVPPAKRAAELCTIHDLTCVRFPQLCTADVLQYPGLIERALRRGAHVHAVSSFVAGEVAEHFDIDADRIHVIPNGVSDVGAGDPARGHEFAGASRYVLALGTVEPRKDLPTLVRAFDKVAADVDDVRLVLAGPDGWGADALNAAIAAAAHRSRIQRLGWVDGHGRADLLAGAAVFAYPSLYEGFGLPPLEAMAAGAPVVTTRAGALPETVGDAALLVEPGDVEGLAAALSAVLVDDHVRQKLIAAGTRRAAEFSWNRTVDQLAGLYRTLC